MAAMANVARMAAVPRTAPGFGEWPNTKDSRPVPATGSLVGAHKIEGNYSPPIGFTLAQDFMPSLNLREAGALPSGATRLAWTVAPTATGYALAMFGGTQTGDVIVWTSAKSAAMTPAMDYLPPSEVKKLVASGHDLAPSTSECVLPVAKARFKTTASLMLGMPQMGAAPGTVPCQQQPPKKKKRFGIGDVLKGAIPIPGQ